MNSHILSVAATWQCLVVHQSAFEREPTDDNLRLLIDAHKDHERACKASLLASFKRVMPGVLKRSEERLARVRK